MLPPQIGIDEVREIFDKPGAAFDDLLLDAMRIGRRVMLANLFKLLNKQVRVFSFSGPLPCGRGELCVFQQPYWLS